MTFGELCIGDWFWRDTLFPERMYMKIPSIMPEVALYPCNCVTSTGQLAFFEDDKEVFLIDGKFMGNLIVRKLNLDDNSVLSIKYDKDLWPAENLLTTINTIGNTVQENYPNVKIVACPVGIDIEEEDNNAR